MKCRSNDGRSTIEIPAEYLTSGYEECENNPLCAADEGKGPISPGNYDMLFGTNDNHPTWWWLRRRGIGGYWNRYWYTPENDGGTRAGHFLHHGSFSLGCITMKNKAFWEKINVFLKKDSVSGNVLSVID